MHFAPDWRLRAAVVLCLGWLLLASPVRGELALAPSETDPALEAVGPGFDRWLAAALDGAGARAVALERGGEAGLADAAARGASHALVPWLEERAGSVEVRLALVVPGSGSALAVASARAPLAAIGEAAADALADLAGPLGVAPEALAPPRLGELAAVTRALRLRREGHLLEAWRAVQGKLAPTAMAVREEIAAEARRGGASPAERARVLAAAGDVLGAWALVGGAAKLELDRPEPDVAVLVAAGEVQIARHNPRSALGYFEAALPFAPDSADVQLGIGQARLQQGDEEAARAALERAVALDPGDPRALALLMDLDEGAPLALARRHLETGRIAARQLEPARARDQLARAPALDPALRAEAALALGALEARIGRPAEALAAYERAAAAGAAGPETWAGLGRAQRALGRAEAAEASLRRAVQLAPDHGPALYELGALLVEGERPAEALPVLRRAHAVQPAGPVTQLALARALHLSGAHAESVELLLSGGHAGEARVLRELARGQAAAGDAAGARESLARAVRLRPHDPELSEAFAAALEAGGDPEAAAAERARLSPLAIPEATGDAGTTEPARAAVDFDGLVLSFAAGVLAPEKHRVVLLDLREPGGWRNGLRRLTRPREPDADRVERDLREAIRARFELAPGDAESLDAIATYVDPLFAFEEPASLSAENVARINTVLGSDGVFVARLIAHPQDHASVHCAEGDFAIETRLLSGVEPASVSILAASDCLSDGMALYGRWNAAAGVVLALLLVGVGYPFARGWGTLVVRIQLPDKTKGFFSIFITTGPNQVRKELVDKKTGREKLVARRSFDPLRRFRKHMAPRENVFRLIPARRNDYIVTVGGPLLDAQGQQIIGHFLEERPVRVLRRAVTELEFDFRPRECAVEIKVAQQGRPAGEARVAVAGDPGSLRYARAGQAFLYLGLGEHRIRVGTKRAAAEFRVLIEKLDNAVPLHVDLDDCEAVFRDCPGAVEPFLIGDFASAIAALEATGQPEAARRLRAEQLERQGRAGDAAVELEAAGRLEEAAQLRASGADHAGSASLYEQAGDDARAAAAYRAAGRFEEAARCYERLYAYGEALECWRELGNEQRELDLLEKLGEYFDAAELARSLGEAERAIHDLQQIDGRHPRYRHACRLIAEIVGERGDHDLAIAKFEESFAEVGVEGAALDALESYAGTLERASQREKALSVYEVIRRRDVERSDVSTRIQELRSQLEAPAQEAAAGPPAESRYELIEEIGRGGMGVVYKARDKRLGRVVALKRLPENLRHHPSAVQLFEREARAAAALNHPNIVTLFDAGEEGGTYFITMELLQGRALNEILRRHGRLSFRDAVRIGMQVAAGLHYAHAQRIVHRDIKTSNLFFTVEQVVKIMDFGIAKSMEEVRRSTTVVGGTPYYMAPEQARGEGVDHHADLYALGVTLFQLVTGDLPFKDGDVTYQHAHRAPPDPRALQPNVPEPLAALILRLMAKHPDERPAHAAEVAESLRALLE